MEFTNNFKFFKGLRALALTAFFCTVALTAFIWGEALTPGDKSAIQSTAISDGIQTAMKTDESAPEVSAIDDYSVTSIVRDGRTVSGNSYYIGDVVTISPVCVPSNADTSKLFLTAENNGVVIDGFSITLLYWGWHHIAIRSKNNPDSVLYDATIYCLGDNPENFTSFKLSIFSSDSSPIVDNVLYVGREYWISLLTDNNREISTASSKLFIDDVQTVKTDNIVFLDAQQYFYPLKEGTLRIKFVYNGIESEKTVTIKNDKAPPEGFEFSNDRITKNTDGSFNLTMKKGELVHLVGDFGLHTKNENSPIYCNYSSSSEYVAQASAFYIRAKSIGTATITYTSLYDNNVKLIIHVVVPENVDGLSIVGNDRCLKNGTISLSAYTGGNPTKNVKWEIVKGKGKIDENGKFTSSKNGKVVVRATYLGRPDLTVEKTITVSIFDSFHTAIRKGIGHFSLFLILGFGFASTFFLLVRPRYLSLPLAIFSSFVAAGISEMFQLPFFTTGRYASWADVLIDFLGSLSGIGIAVVITIVVALIWKKARPSDFSAMKNEFMFLTFKTAFKKTDNVFEKIS